MGDENRPLENNIDGLTIQTEDEIYRVDKPWGFEKWYAFGQGQGYVLKMIHINPPTRSSVQVHVEKCETNIVVSGEGILHYHPMQMDISRLVEGTSNPYSQDEINDIVRGLQQERIHPGKVFQVFPGWVHSVEAVGSEPLVMYEASTLQVDDVIRLYDQTGRGSGRIDSEHKDARK